MAATVDPNRLTSPTSLKKSVVIAFGQADEQLLDRRDLLGLHASRLHERLGGVVEIEPSLESRNPISELFGFERPRDIGSERGVIRWQEHDLRHAHQQLNASQLQVIAWQADRPVLVTAEQFFVGQ